MSKYNPWPLGQIPKELQRQEPYIIREMGYKWDDPRDIVDIFEKKVAKFAGSNYAVSTDSCTHAIFLSLQYLMRFSNIFHELAKKLSCLNIPAHTYISIPQQLSRASILFQFNNIKWHGIYQLEPTRIWDAALRWTKGMYIKDSLMCLSFQIKKRIPIGRGGMILCDKKEEYNWLKLASYDGRDLNTPYDSEGHVKMNGWHYYMTPEDAARGIILMDSIPEVNEDQGGWENYPDLMWLQRK